MTTSTIRRKLITYLNGADDSKIKALYTLLEKEIQEESFIFTKEQLEILENERDLHLSGQSKSYSREESFQIITGQLQF